MWDERYNTPNYMYGKEPNDFLKANIRHIPKGPILCLADGEGETPSIWLNVAMMSPRLIYRQSHWRKQESSQQEQGVRVNFIHADLASYDLGQQQWDGIVSIFCHLPSALRTKLHHAVYRSLQNSGTYLVEGYTPQQLHYKTGGPSAVDMMLSAEILAQELHPMHPFTLTEKERFIQEGQLHNGLSHVVQALFIKPENEARIY
ncbi:class I SAM-dependent methyltransferase [Vibrio sp. PP-XX7]